jgi:hypothetical protein
MSEIIITGNNDVEIKSTRIVRYEAGKLVEIVPTLLLDTSGSMKQFVGSSRKIDILQDVVRSIGMGYARYSFSDDIRREDSGEMLDAGGNTALAVAFNFLKESGVRRHLVLVSDGVPDDVDEALESVRGLGYPVNVVYIGNIGDVGERFMRKIAETTGGKWLTADVKDAAFFQKNLESGIEKLMLIG